MDRGRMPAKRNSRPKVDVALRVIRQRCARLPSSVTGSALVRSLFSYYLLNPGRSDNIISTSDFPISYCGSKSISFGRCYLRRCCASSPPSALMASSNQQQRPRTVGANQKLISSLISRRPIHPKKSMKAMSSRRDATGLRAGDRHRQDRRTILTCARKLSVSRRRQTAASDNFATTEAPV